MQNFAKSLARKAAGPAAAVAAGVTCAQARAPAPVVPCADVRLRVAKLEDEWVGVTHENGIELQFQSYGREDIDAGVKELAAVFRPRYSSAVVISEISPDGSECTDGAAADGIIESADVRHASAAAAFSVGGGQDLNTLLQMTAKMAQRPGFQREMVAGMMEDPDLFNMMLTQCDNLDAYVAAAGFPLPASMQLTPAEEGQEGQEGKEGAEGPHWMRFVGNRVATMLERTGGALSHLGHWLRDRFAFQGHSTGAGGAPAGGMASPDKVMKTIAFLGLVLMCLMLRKRFTRFRMA